MSPDPTQICGMSNTWLFDLDNTLYPAGCEFMDLIEGKMTDFMRQTGLDRVRRPGPCRSATTPSTAPPCAG
jgi:hypothetical protein